MPVDQADRVARYVGPGEHRPGLTRLGSGEWARTRDRVRRAVADIARDLLELYAARQVLPRPRLLARHALAAGAGSLLPLRRDARPARGDQRGEARHGGAAADGPPDLRRRRLRQDRGRDPRRLQGRDGRQAGRRPRADDRPRPAALQHLPRAPRQPSRARRDALALPQRPRGTRRGRRTSPTAASTSSSARTASCRRTSSSRTSAS